MIKRRLRALQAGPAVLDDVLGGDVVGVAAVAAVAAVAVIMAFFLWRANKATAVDPHETISENPAFGSGASAGATA